MKQTPKSCSCKTCRMSKSSNYGNSVMRQEERNFRHKQNQLLRVGKEPIEVATYTFKIG